jgi:hypothetical protein
VRTSTRITAIYAQLVDAAGAAVGDASVETKGGIADSDANGFVQIEVGVDAVLTAERADGSICSATVPALDGKAVFVDVGRLVCVAVKP